MENYLAHEIWEKTSDLLNMNKFFWYLHVDHRHKRLIHFLKQTCY
jgi:hypothetical protein